MAETSSPNGLPCTIPYQSLHSLNALPSFSEKAFLFTHFCFVAGLSPNYRYRAPEPTFLGTPKPVFTAMRVYGVTLYLVKPPSWGKVSGGHPIPLPLPPKKSVGWQGRSFVYLPGPLCLGVHFTRYIANP